MKIKVFFSALYISVISKCYRSSRSSRWRLKRSTYRVSFFRPIILAIFDEITSNFHRIFKILYLMFYFCSVFKLSQGMQRGHLASCNMLAHSHQVAVSQAVHTLNNFLMFTV